MAYMDYNGMVREGLNPNANPGPGGASSWSPWGAQTPNAYETGFEPRNYKPHGYTPTNQTTQPTTPAQISAPSVPPMSPLNLGLTGGGAGGGYAGGGSGSTGNSGGGMATYRTGIEHGLLSNQAIDRARSALQPTAPMPTANVPQNAQQHSAMSQQYHDIMGQGTQKADMELTRDAAYQQQQMQLAQQRALAGAATAGMGNLVGLNQANTQYNTGMSGLDVSQRGLQQSLLLRLLNGLGV